MSEHKVTVDWKRETPDFAYGTYNRDHDWSFDAGVTVRASANPAYLGSETCVDPEEAFVASLSSCHMLTFLAIAAAPSMDWSFSVKQSTRMSGRCTVQMSAMSDSPVLLSISV